MPFHFPKPFPDFDHGGEEHVTHDTSKPWLSKGNVAEHSNKFFVKHMLDTFHDVSKLPSDNVSLPSQHIKLLDFDI